MLNKYYLLWLFLPGQSHSIFPVSAELELMSGTGRENIHVSQGIFLIRSPLFLPLVLMMEKPLEVASQLWDVSHAVEFLECMHEPWKVLAV